MTMRMNQRNQDQNAAMLEILNHTHTKIVHLKGLNMEYLFMMVCNLLSVDSLPEPLQKIIQERSHGVPLWCEELVETMIELQYMKAREH